MTSISPESFMAQVPPDPSGNSAFAQRYGRELRDVIKRYAARLPRNVQRHLGPSELGYECDRMVTGKMAGPAVRHTNNIGDPWASIVGTSLHSFYEQAFTWENQQLPAPRWLTEARVTPDPQAPRPHPGTADLYDVTTFSVTDWKNQSEGMRAKLRAHGPPRHYFIQLLLYALGYVNLGFRVDRVVLVSMPRTKSTLDDMYTWEHAIAPADWELMAEVLRQTAVREEIAKEVVAGRLSFMDVPATPSDEACHYCPFYRSQAAYDPTAYGCPGTALRRVG